MDLKAQIEESVNLIYPSTENLAEGKTTSPDEKTAASDQAYTIYPEALLHSTKNGNKYYTTLQSLTRQFESSKPSSGEKYHGSVVQFGQSKLNQLSRQKVQYWENKDQNYEVDEEEEIVSRSNTPTLTSFVSGNGSSLFSWSSNDKYIAARKRELQRVNASLKDENKALSLRPVPANTSKFDKQNKPRNADLGYRLMSVVETESNRFIKDRIELIKAHHTEQACKKIDERKRKDHEMHLRRVQLKEEKYEITLKAAIAKQNAKRNSWFFGSLFGSKPISNSFTFQIPKTEEAGTSPPQTCISNDQIVSSLQIGNHALELSKLSNNLSQSHISQNESTAQGHIPVKDISFDGLQLELHSSRSSTSSFEFEEFQSSTERTESTNSHELPASVSNAAPPNGNAEKKALDIASERSNRSNAVHLALTRTDSDFSRHNTSDLVSL